MAVDPGRSPSEPRSRPVYILTLNKKQKKKFFDNILKFVTSFYDVITVSAKFLLHIEYAFGARLCIGALIVGVCGLIVLL